MSQTELLSIPVEEEEKKLSKKVSKKRKSSVELQDNVDGAFPLEHDDPKRGFRINRATLMLTYSGCVGVTKDDILSHFRSFVWPLRKYVIGEEIAPSTGLTHFHCLFVFQDPVNITNRDKLKIRKNGQLFGVNVRKLGSGKANYQRAYEYCIKDDSFIESAGWDFFISSDQFQKRYADFKAFKHYRK